MYTLGINAVYHDPAACLVKDGQLLAAAEEERFTHIKHGKRPIPFSTYELPFHAAAVLTLDGRGEKATTTYSLGEGNHLRWLGQVNFPHSLGMLYEDVTSYLGFLPSSDEYKVMALASFGKPRYLSIFLEMVQP